MRPNVVWALLVPLLAQVTTSGDAEAALQRVGSHVASSSTELAAAWKGLASVCASEASYQQRQDELARLQTAIEGAVRRKSAATHQQAHLQDQVAEGEQSYASASAMLSSTTGKLQEEMATANATLASLHEVTQMIAEAMGDSGASGQVLGVIKGMAMSSEESIKTLGEQIETKGADFTALMGTAASQVRALQELYVTEHARGMAAAAELDAVKAQRGLLKSTAEAEDGLDALRDATCSAARQTEVAFSAQVESVGRQSENAQAAVAAAASLLRVRVRPVAVAGAEVDALAAKLDSPSLHRLAEELRTQTPEADQKLLTQLQRALTEKVGGDDCELAREQAAAHQASVRDEVLALQEQNATYTAGAKVATAMTAILEPVAARVAAKGPDSFSDFNASVQESSELLTSAATELGQLQTFANAEAAKEGARGDAASLPRLVRNLASTVASLQSELAVGQAGLADATATLRLRTEVLSTAWSKQLSDLSGWASTNASHAARKAGSLTRKQAELEEAREATQQARACVSTTSQEKAVVGVAIRSLRGT